MKQLVVAVVSSLALSWSPARAAADEAAAAPDPDASRIGFYAEVSVWTGSVVPVDARGALGISFGRDRGPDWRVGLVVDVLHEGGYGAGFGLEGQVDWPVGGGWRLGPRLAASAVDGTGDGAMGMAGLRVRHAPFVLGADGIIADADDEKVAGVAIGAGIDGEAGKTVLAFAAACAALLGVVAVIGLSQADLN